MPTVSNTYKVQTNTIQSEVFEVMKTHRNKTSRELHEFLPHLTLQNVSAAVNALKVKGLVAITDHKQETSDAGNVKSYRCYSVDFGKVKKYTPPSVPSNAQPDLFGQLIETLKAEVDMLQQWRAAAILRYPDLDVDPLLLEARALLAAESEEQNCKPAAHAYINGNRDHTIAVQALVKALGSRK
jgi:hypothetical protein